MPLTQIWIISFVAFVEAEARTDPSLRRNSFLCHSEVGCECIFFFFFSFSPPHYISFHFCGSLADWSDCCYGMCCGTKGAEIQKTQWPPGEASLPRSLSLPLRVPLLSHHSSAPSPSPSVHVLFSHSAYPELVFPPLTLSLSLCLSLARSFSLSGPPHFDVVLGPGTLAWPLLYSLSLFCTHTHTHTHTQSYILSLQQHRLVHAQKKNHTNTHLKHTHTHTLTNRNVWESPSGYLCNLHLKLVRGQEANRPRRLNANSGEAGWLPGWDQRSSPHSSTLLDMHEQLPHTSPHVCVRV